MGGADGKCRDLDREAGGADAMHGGLDGGAFFLVAN